jgi:ubiquinol-cytochrome c reductase core subunit 2
MLAARTPAAARLAARGAARRFATVVDAGGVRVAATDADAPTASVTLLVKAGSRFESKPGQAHALKNFAFKVRARSPSEPRG